MSTYAQDVRRWILKAEKVTRDTFVASSLKVHESIVAGSGLTGAPGQPVDTGYLRSSFILSFGDTEPTYPTAPQRVSGRTDAPVPAASAPQGSAGTAWTARVTTNAKYAEYIEEGVRATRSAVGGPGSVKLTIAAWPRIVDTSAKEQGSI
jgi:hypothetical protein